MERSLGERHSSLGKEYESRRSLSAGRRWLLVIAGSIAVGVGVLGVFVPLLPATPFLLLAAGCYVRSSPRLYRWLLTNRWTGEYIRNFREGKGMPRRAKVAAVALLWATLLVSAFLVRDPRVWLVLGSVGLGVPWLILSIPTLETESKDRRDRPAS